MNRELLEKIRTTLFSGKFGLYLKRTLFVNIAVLTGVWFGMKAFFPDDFVLAKINKALFIKDMGLTAEDVSVSIFGTVSFKDGVLLEKGSKVVTFQKLRFSPSFFDLLKRKLSGTLFISDINNQGGEMRVTFDTSEKPCYFVSSEDLPLSLFQPFLKDISFTGILTGESSICVEEGRKYEGKIDMRAADVVFRGKIPTPMGDFDVGRIELGDFELVTTVADSKAEIEKLIINGILNLDALGKITLNSKSMMSSRLDLDVRIDIPDMTKVSEKIGRAHV